MNKAEYQSNQALEIRAPVESDFDAYICFIQQIAEETKFTYHYPNEPLPSKEAQIALWQSPYRYTQAIFDSDKMVGYFCFYVTNPNHPYLKHNGGTHTYILREYQGRGLGTYFLKNISEHATRMGVKRISANIHADNAANLKCMQRQGFVIESVKKNRYFVDGKYVDCYELVKWID